MVAEVINLVPRNSRYGPKLVAEHGYGAYQTGRCRCEICKAAKRDYMRGWRAELLAKLLADPDHPFHGVRSAYDAGCRCTACRAGRRASAYRLGENDSEAQVA